MIVTITATLMKSKKDPEDVKVICEYDTEVKEFPEDKQEALANILEKVLSKKD